MEEKKKRIVTRDALGAWDVKYNWHFRSDFMDRYVAALKDKKFLATRCHQCGRVYSPPMTRCGRCFIELHEWTEVKDRGKVVMYTVAYNAISGEPLPEPKITALIQLDGANAWMLAPIKNTKPEEMHTGLRVHAGWAEERKGILADINGFEADR
jgi:hypothetical protein